MHATMDRVPFPSGSVPSPAPATATGSKPPHCFHQTPRNSGCGCPRPPRIESSSCLGCCSLARPLSPSSTAQAWLVCSTYLDTSYSLVLQKGSSQTRTSHPSSAQLLPLTEAPLPFSTAPSNFSKPKQLASSRCLSSLVPTVHNGMSSCTRLKYPRAPLTIAGPLRLCPHRGRQPREVYV